MVQTDEWEGAEAMMKLYECATCGSCERLTLAPDCCSLCGSRVSVVDEQLTARENRFFAQIFVDERHSGATINQAFQTAEQIIRESHESKYRNESDNSDRVIMLDHWRRRYTRNET